MKILLIAWLPAMLALTSCKQAEPPVHAGSIWLINEGNIDEMVQNTPGHLLVHFSSHDKNCRYCIASNEKIVEMAREFSPGLTYARITWEPWYRGPEDVLEDYEVKDLPTYVLYRDGREFWRGAGDDEKIYAQLSRKLEVCCSTGKKKPGSGG